MKTIHILGGLAAFAISCAASAQYVGPSNQPTYANVAAVNSHPVDDASVVLQGYLTRKIGGDKYLFSDGTGEIQVEIDDKIFPRTEVGATTRVEIRGEIEKELLHALEIDVKAVRVL